MGKISLSGLRAFVRRRFSLKVALVFLSLAAAIAVLGGGTTVLLQEEIEDNVRENYATLAHAEAENLASWNDQNARTARLLSENVEARESEQAIREYLRAEHLDLSRTVQGIHYVNTTRDEVVASTGVALEGRTLSSLAVPWAQPEGGVPEEVTTTGVYRGPNVTGSRALIAYVAPVGDDETDRMLVLTVRPAAYTPVRSQFGQTQTIVVDRSERVVISQEFVSLLPYADDEVGQAPIEAARRSGPEQPGSLIVPASTTVSDALTIERSDPVVVGYSQVPDIGWIVLVHVPVSTAFGFARAVTTAGIATTALGVFAIGAAGWWFGRNTAAQIDRLTSTAQRLEAGDEVNVSTNRTDTIGQLYAAFDQMATEIRERERDLRERSEALAAERNRLASLFDNATDAIAHLSFHPDDGYEILAVNSAFERAFGYSEDDDPPPYIEERDVAVIPGGADDVIDDARTADEGVEARLQTSDAVRDFLIRVVPVGERETATEGYVVYTDITERKESKRALERHRDLLERTERLASVGGLEVGVEAGRPGQVRLTDELYRIHDLQDGSPITLGDVLECYHPDDRERIREAIEEAIDTGDQYDVEGRLVADGDYRWIRTTGEAIHEDGEVVRVRGALQDITRRKRHELALESLHEVVQQLLQIRDEREVGELVVESASDVLSLAGVGIYLFDSGENRLAPTAFSSGFRAAFGEPTAVDPSDGDSTLWDVFVTGEPVVVDGPERMLGDAPPGGDNQAVCFPIGEHGVFVIGSESPALDARTRQLSELLVATTEAALDRLENERAVRERDEQLKEQNRRLRHQIRVNEIIRRIDNVLVEATSREDIETAVCNRLMAVDMFKFAWIGEYDPDGSITPRYWSGEGEEYLDVVSLAASQEPSVVAAETGRVTVVGNTVDEVRREAWRSEALDKEFNSVISVPLVRDGYTYSVLTVYATESDAFGQLERSVFAELGETIVNAITAVETRRALETDHAIELRIDVTDADDLLPRVARKAGAAVELEGIASQGGDRTRLFFTADVEYPDDLIGVLERFVTVESARHVAQTSTGHLFEASVTGPTLASTLADRGASLEGLTIDGRETTIDVVVPGSTDVRKFLDRLSEDVPGVELLARQDVERPIQTLADLRTAVLDDLTDRQCEVLLTSYYSGYYEWPRATTGEEIASMLGVSQPTINRHLRIAQQTVLSALLDSTAGGADHGDQEG
jgi:predicted DNA binding protein/PAS domain-containing protein